jgi:hypothetical protein
MREPTREKCVLIKAKDGLHDLIGWFDRLDRHRGAISVAKNAQKGDPGLKITRYLGNVGLRTGGGP